MLVQPLVDTTFESPIPGLMVGWVFARLFIFIAPESGAVRADYECGKKIGFCFANPANESGGDHPWSCAKDQPVAERLQPCSNLFEVGQKIAGGVHISAFPPGGTAPPSSASGIGLIGFAGAVLFASSVL